MSEALNRQSACEAVDQAAIEFRDRLDAFGIVLQGDGLQESYGAWLLPAALSATTAVRKSYELHRLLEEIEDRLKDQTNQTFTIDLLTQARS